MTTQPDQRSGAAAGPTPYVARPAVEAAAEQALRPGGLTVLLGPAGIGKSRLAARLLRSRRVAVTSAATSVHADARQVLADLVSAAGAAPPGMLFLLRTSDDDEVMRAAGLHLGRVLDAVLVEEAEQLDADELVALRATAQASGLPWLVTSRVPPEHADLEVVEVPPLEDHESLSLAREVLPGASPELEAFVVQHGRRNPLQIEQLTRLLLESGAAVMDGIGTGLAQRDALLPGPTSMRDFVASRLTLLPPLERQLVSTAAVLGEIADADLLQHLLGGGPEVVEPLVARLTSRGLVQRSPSNEGGAQLRFAHGLVREVAYAELAVEERVRIHRAAAEWYAVLPVAQVLEAQAHHLEAAVRLSGADCELLRRTVEAMVLFARSVESERTRVGREVLVRARELAESRTECRVDTLDLELAWAEVTLTTGEHEQAMAAARRALRLAEERAQDAVAAAAHVALARVDRSRDPETALSHLAAAEVLFEQLQDQAGRARVEVERSWVAQRTSGLPQQLEHMERAFTLAMRSGDARLQAAAAQDLAIHHATGTGRAAFELWAARARECSRADDASLEPKLDLAAGVLAMFELAPVKGRAASRSALDRAEELGLSFVLRNALTTELDLLLLDGRLTEVEELLPQARAVADRQVTEWQHLQYSLIEARLRQRQGDITRAHVLLDDVGAHELADRIVLRRDLAEARAWVALESGHFDQARALADQAVLLDEEMGERCAPLRPRLVDLLALVAQGQDPTLGDVAALRAASRETGLDAVAELANRWLLVDDLRRGWAVDLYHVSEVDVIEARALDLEIEGLSSRTWDRLLDAAQVWAELGTTVWQARALLWHSELTGTPQPEADRLLEVLQSPAGLGDRLRAQVRGLRG